MLAQSFCDYREKKKNSASANFRRRNVCKSGEYQNRGETGDRIRMGEAITGFSTAGDAPVSDERY